MADNRDWPDIPYPRHRLIPLQAITRHSQVIAALRSFQIAPCTDAPITDRSGLTLTHHHALAESQTAVLVQTTHPAQWAERVDPASLVWHFAVD
jgi:hypothetical protein